MAAAARFYSRESWIISNRKRDNQCLLGESEYICCCILGERRGCCRQESVRVSQRPRGKTTLLLRNLKAPAEPSEKTLADVKAVCKKHCERTTIVIAEC